MNNSIELKDLELTDAPDLFNIIDTQREHIGRWTEIANVTNSVTDTQKFIESTIEKKENIKVILFNGNKVGLVGTRNTDKENRATEIGYWIDKNYEGKGIVTQSTEAFINKLHENGINKFEIHAIPLNARSCQVAEHLGFDMVETKYNCQELHGNKFDQYIYRKTFSN